MLVNGYNPTVVTTSVPAIAVPVRYRPQQADETRLGPQQDRSHNVL